jgi:hypothetical protein
MSAFSNPKAVLTLILKFSLPQNITQYKVKGPKIHHSGIEGDQAIHFFKAHPKPQLSKTCPSFPAGHPPGLAVKKLEIS